MVELTAHNREVMGSIPILATNYNQGEFQMGAQNDEGGKKLSFDFRSAFLGQEGENSEFLKYFIDKLIEEVVQHRKNPTTVGDIDSLPESINNSYFKLQLDGALNNLFKRLRGKADHSELTQQENYDRGTIEVWNSRYLAHMLSDGLLPAALGRLIGDLTWQNNVYQVVSTTTTFLEHEVIATLAKILGYSTARRPFDDSENQPKDQPCAGGRLTSGGTIATCEALWIMREKSFAALGVYSALHELNLIDRYEARFDDKIETVDDVRKDFWKVYNRCLEISGKEYRKAFEDASSSYRYMYIDRYGRQNLPRPVYITSVEAHYSLNKNVALLGGSIPNDDFLEFASKDSREKRQNRLEELTDRYDLWFVDVDKDLRMDLDGLRRFLDKAVQKRKLGHDAVMVTAVIPTLGTTEPSVFDPLHDILKIRAEYYRKERLWFYIHADCAWGGMFRLVRSSMKPAARLALDSTSAADSCTVDPHKLGYIPYPAGALVLRDRRDRAFIDVKANYLPSSTDLNMDFNLGVAAIEGSKPASSALACWLTFLSMTSEAVTSPVDAKDPCDLYRPILLNNLKVTDQLAKALEQLGYVDIVHPVEGNLICLQIVPQQLGTLNFEDAIKANNSATDLLITRLNSLANINSRRNFVVSDTKIARTDRKCLRVTVMNPYLFSSSENAILPQILEDFVKEVDSICRSPEFIKDVEKMCGVVTGSHEVSKH